MLREHSSTGKSEKVWKKENSPKLVRISLHSRRTTKKSESNPVTEEKKRKKHEL